MEQPPPLSSVPTGSKPIPNRSVAERLPGSHLATAPTVSKPPAIQTILLVLSFLAICGLVIIQALTLAQIKKLRASQYSVQRVEIANDRPVEVEIANRQPVQVAGSVEVTSSRPLEVSVENRFGSPVPVTVTR